MRYQLNRDVTQKECPWLDADLPKGSVVWRYDGCTYGCVGPGGKAVSLEKNQTPFFELPESALRQAREEEQK